MKLTKESSLKLYAKMINTLNTEPLENILAKDFCYASQMVLDEISSKHEFLNYIRAKLQTIANENSFIYAEMGEIVAYGEKQPCVILAQNSRENLVGLVLAKIDDDKLKRLDLCVVPSPQSAIRSGEYPT